MSGEKTFEEFVTDFPKEIPTLEDFPPLAREQSDFPKPTPGIQSLSPEALEELNRIWASSLESIKRE